MLITVNKMIKAEACYTEKKLRRLIGDGLTPKQVMALKIPKLDKLFALSMSSSKKKLESIWKKEEAFDDVSKGNTYYYYENYYLPVDNYCVAKLFYENDKKFLDRLAEAL